MSSKASNLSFPSISKNADEEDEAKIQFAKEVTYFAFSLYDNNAEIADYIGNRFSRNYGDKNWNCVIYELNRGNVVYRSFNNNSAIILKYNNYKIIIWNNN